jgi:hypothetical protein
MKGKQRKRRYLLSLVKFCFTTGCILKVEWKCGDGRADAMDLGNLNLHLPVRRDNSLAQTQAKDVTQHD